MDLILRNSFTASPLALRAQRGPNPRALPRKEFGSAPFISRPKSSLSRGSSGDAARSHQSHTSPACCSLSAPALKPASNMESAAEEASRCVECPSDTEGRSEGTVDRTDDMECEAETEDMHAEARKVDKRAPWLPADQQGWRKAPEQRKLSESIANGKSTYRQWVRENTGRDVAEAGAYDADVVSGLWTCCRNIDGGAPGCVRGDHCFGDLPTDTAPCADCGQWVPLSRWAYESCQSHKGELKTNRWGGAWWDCCGAVGVDGTKNDDNAAAEWVARRQFEMEAHSVKRAQGSLSAPRLIPAKPSSGCITRTSHRFAPLNAPNLECGNCNAEAVPGQLVCAGCGEAYRVCTQCVAVLSPEAVLEGKEMAGRDGGRPPCRFHPGTYCEQRATRWAHNQKRSYPCSNAGCTHTSPHRSLVNAHAMECPYTPMECDLGCGCTIIRKDFQAHRDGCDYVVLTCPNGCGESHRRDTMQAHFAQCWMQPIPCERACFGCEVLPLRRDVAEHDAVCEYGQRVCEFRCGFACLRRDWAPSGHEAACPLATSLCELGCGAEVPRRFKEEHYARECANALLECRWCAVRFRRDEHSTHEDGCLLRSALRGWWQLLRKSCVECGTDVFGREEQSMRARRADAEGSRAWRTPMQRHVEDDCPCTRVPCPNRCLPTATESAGGAGAAGAGAGAGAAGAGAGGAGAGAGGAAGGDDGEGYDRLGRVGCTAIVRRDELRAHLSDDCPYTRIACTLGCGALVLRCKMRSHLTATGCPKLKPIPCPRSCGALVQPDGSGPTGTASHDAVCPLMRVACEFCAQVHERRGMDAHLTVCVEVSVDCARNCGASFPRKQTEAHADVCPKKPQLCPYGCGETVSLGQLRFFPVERTGADADEGMRGRDGQGEVDGVGNGRGRGLGRGLGLGLGRGRGREAFAEAGTSGGSTLGPRPTSDQAPQPPREGWADTSPIVCAPCAEEPDSDVPAGVTSGRVFTTDSVPLSGLLRETGLDDGGDGGGGGGDFSGAEGSVSRLDPVSSVAAFRAKVLAADDGAATLRSLLGATLFPPTEPPHASRFVSPDDLLDVRQSRYASAARFLLLAFVRANAYAESAALLQRVEAVLGTKSSARAVIILLGGDEAQLESLRQLAPRCHALPQASAAFERENLSRAFRVRKGALSLCVLEADTAQLACFDGGRAVLADEFGARLGWRDMASEHSRVCPQYLLGCPNTGCTMLKLRRQMREHLVSCASRLLPCRRHCGAVLPVKEHKSHAPLCPMRPVACPLACGETVALARLDDGSHAAECALAAVFCSACDQKLTRNGLRRHMQVCPQALELCRYGCSMRLPRCQMAEHAEKCPRLYGKRFPLCDGYCCRRCPLHYDEYKSKGKSKSTASFTAAKRNPWASASKTARENRPGSGRKPAAPHHVERKEWMMSVPVTVHWNP